MLAGSDAGRRTVRQLEMSDLERMAAIDRAHVGRSRRHFFEKRMAAARLSPHDFIQIGVVWGGSLCGFAVARILRGEFGQEHVVAVLDAIAVEPDSQECGVGQCLMQEFATIMQRMRIRSLHSQVAWKDQSLLRFFSASGFELAPRLALERTVGERLDEVSEEI
jgi:L-amino acid N-acyltransferase YncA